MAINSRVRTLFGIIRKSIKLVVSSSFKWIVIYHFHRSKILVPSVVSEHGYD